MRPWIVSVCAVTMFAAVTTFSGAERPSRQLLTTPMANAEGARLLRRLPVAFVPNHGQWEHAACFAARMNRQHRLGARLESA